MTNEEEILRLVITELRKELEISETKRLAELSRRIEAEEALNIYCHLKPEKFYMPTDMTKDEAIEKMTQDPSIVARADGGEDARNYFKKWNEK